MRAELIAADERHEVRRAIERWGEGRVIDAPTAASLRARYADDRRRARAAFRATFFVFTVLAGQGIWGFGLLSIEAATGSSSATVPNAVWLALLALAAGAGAAWALGPLRLRGFGVEEGLAALALGFGIGAVVLGLDEAQMPGRAIAGAVGLGVAVAAAGAAWRWGLAASGAVAAAGLFLALATMPAARLAWMVVSAALAVAARRWRHHDRRPVAHRRRAGEVYAVALVALWIAAHPSRPVGSAFAALAGGADPWPLRGAAAIPLGWIVVIGLPVLLLASGLTRRDRLELALGGIAALAAGASLVDALDLGPPWAVLLGSGVLLGAVAWILRRLLGASTDRVRGGFTDRELIGASSDAGWLELAATLAALSPVPRPAEPTPAFEGRGGEFGGGGASAGF